MTALQYPPGMRFAVRSYFDQHTRGFDTGTHRSAIELVYVESGRCKYEITASSGKIDAEYLKTGDLIFIAENTPHRLTVEKEARLLLLELRAVTNGDGKDFLDVKTVFGNCGSILTAFKDKPYIVINDFSYVKQAMLRIVNLLNTNRLEYADHYFTQVLIAGLFLNIDESYKKAYLGNPYVERIIEFIARSYQEKISVQDIAEAVNLNPSYMQKLFAKHMGNTVYDYLTQFRINRAVTLMKSTDMAFEDIAAEAGFNNRQSFYNAFRAFTNYTPKLFKKYLASPVIDFEPKS